MKLRAAAAAAAGAVALLGSGTAAAAGPYLRDYYATDPMTGSVSGTFEAGVSTALSPTFPFFIEGRLFSDFGDHCHQAFYAVNGAAPSWRPLSAPACDGAGADIAKTLDIPKKHHTTPAVKVCWSHPGSAVSATGSRCGSKVALTAG